MTTTQTRNSSRRSSTASSSTATIERPRRQRRSPRSAQPVRERDWQRTSSTTTATPLRPSRERVFDPGSPARRGGSRPRVVPARTGSAQVLSVRGRRVVRPKVDTTAVRFWTAGVVVLIIGIALAMVLSMKITEQAFETDQLRQQDRALSNEIETLTRDVQQARSAAVVVRRAHEFGMVVPEQPGAIKVDERGMGVSVSQPDPSKTLPITDVNDERVRPRLASSNPQEAAQLVGQVHSIPQQESTVSVPAVAPYAPTIAGTNTAE